MADTARTEAAIKALLADNPTGDISEQDLRDFAETLLRRTDAAKLHGLSGITGADIQAQIDGIGAGEDGRVVAPPGVIELSEPLEVTLGIALSGCGAHYADGAPGTTFVPADDFPDDGSPGIYLRHPKGSGSSLPHNASIRHLQVRGFPGPGIIAHSMGENSLIDDVAVYNNGSDGIRVTGFGTPIHFGRLSLHGNGGAGLKIEGQNTSHVQVIYIAADNNTDGLVSITGGSTETNFHLLGWKSERWGDTPGHEDIFKVHNGNGGIYDFGTGRIACLVESTGAVVRQTADVNNTVGKVKFLCTIAVGAEDYAFGYLNEVNDKSLTFAQINRQPFSMLAASVGEPT